MSGGPNWDVTAALVLRAKEFRPAESQPHHQVLLPRLTKERENCDT